MIKRVDYDQNGEINYSEFLSGTISDTHFTPENMMLLFKYFDTNNEDLITVQSFEKAFQRSGKHISEI